MIESAASLVKQENDTPVMIFFEIHLVLVRFSQALRQCFSTSGKNTRVTHSSAPRSGAPSLGWPSISVVTPLAAPRTQARDHRLRRADPKVSQRADPQTRR